MLPTASLTSGMAGSTLALQNTPFAGRNLDLSAGFYASGDERRGPPVLLRDVASLRFKTGPDSVDHYDLSRLINVLVTPVGNDLGRVARDIEKVLAGIHLPKDVTVQLRGEVANMRNAIQNFALALPLAVLLIYLVMVGLFRSFVDPTIILVAVPLGWIGTVLMLQLTDTSVNVESMIGTLMMMGIVVSNSILLVDFANRMVSHGASAERAVLEAGKRRIRPILMTALATILGPVAAGPWIRRRERNDGAACPRGRRRPGGQYDHDARGGARHALHGLASSRKAADIGDARCDCGGDLMDDIQPPPFDRRSAQPGRPSCGSALLPCRRLWALCLCAGDAFAGTWATGQNRNRLHGGT
ncbi:MAG: efflux RND transporter permease subunit [Nitrospiraceae bacterium]